VQDGDEFVAEETEQVKNIAHEARLKYESVKGLYEDFANRVASVLADCVAAKAIVTLSITPRAKDPDSFERKAAQLMPGAPNSPKYSDPMEQITDKAGVRVITYFLNTVEDVSRVISEQFEVLEKVLKASDDPARFGYQSLHYLVRYSETRTALPEYEKFKGLVAEVQVRTVLQHAWAEIEHDIQYKSPSVLPRSIQRRFAALAGLVEIADREFQAIEDENQAVQADARRKINLGQLDQVEITPDSLRVYLDKKYGPDGRMSDYSYQWAVRVLLRLGFTNLAQVDECIRDFNDDAISRAVFKGRMGQLTRFEAVLLASMGEGFILAHPWADSAYDWLVSFLVKQLQRLHGAGVTVGSYRPPAYPDTVLRPSDLEAIRLGIQERENNSPASDLEAMPQQIQEHGTDFSSADGSN